MKKIYIVIMFTLSVTLVQAKDAYKGRIDTKAVKIEKKDGTVFLDADMLLNNVHFKSQAMVIITPVLKAREGAHYQDFAPIVFVGGKRNKMLKRQLRFGDYKFAIQPSKTLRHKNRKSETVLMNLSTPYKDWMDNSILSFEQKASGCAGCRLVAKASLPDIPVTLANPDYMLAFITPPVEEIKVRSETYSAYLNYEVGKYDLIGTFKNNAAVLSEVNTIINDIRDDSNLKVSNFKVTGYASPEGNNYSNLILSENRARSFINYLKVRYNWNVSDISWEGKGEDWAGLRKEVEESYIQDRNQIIAIIDEVSDIDERKRRIHALSGGTTYRTLLNYFYPPLRRNDYTITYVARAFNIEEAKVIINTKPQHLSLNEMYMVATSYPKNSQEIKQVFDIAVQLHPYDPVAVINSAALDVENGSYDAGIKLLDGVELPSAWNNIAVAYAKKGDIAKARQYFQKAVDSGDSMAVKNLELLNKAYAQ